MVTFDSTKPSLIYGNVWLDKTFFDLW